MDNFLKKSLDNSTPKETFSNCKDIKLQLFIIYQGVYCAILVILECLQLNVETELKNHIIVFLSCISLIVILIESVDTIKKGKYKRSGALIIFFAAALKFLFEHI